MINVQIVDDHKMVVEGLSLIINESGIAKVSATYSCLDDCRKGLAVFRPDVLLLDIIIPDGSGVDFCAEMRAFYPDLKIIMLTTLQEYSIAKRSLQNGALGYVLKNALSEEVVKAIETVYRDEIYLCDEINLLLKLKRKEELILLTPREKEILQFISEGYSTPQISEKMGITIDTVKGYRKNLLFKFKAKNCVVLVRSAMEQRLI